MEDLNSNALIDSFIYQQTLREDLLLLNRILFFSSIRQREKYSSYLFQIELQREEIINQVLKKLHRFEENNFDKMKTIAYQIVVRISKCIKQYYDKLQIFAPKLAEFLGINTLLKQLKQTVLKAINVSKENSVNFNRILEVLNTVLSYRAEKQINFKGGYYSVPKQMIETLQSTDNLRNPKYLQFLKEGRIQTIIQLHKSYLKNPQKSNNSLNEVNETNKLLQVDRKSIAQKQGFSLSNGISSSTDIINLIKQIGICDFYLTKCIRFEKQLMNLNRQNQKAIEKHLQKAKNFKKLRQNQSQQGERSNKLKQISILPRKSISNTHYQPKRITSVSQSKANDQSNQTRKTTSLLQCNRKQLTIQQINGRSLNKQNDKVEYNKYEILRRHLKLGPLIRSKQPSKERLPLTESTQNLKDQMEKSFKLTKQNLIQINISDKIFISKAMRIKKKPLAFSLKNSQIDK